VIDRGGAAEAARVCPFVALDDDRDRRLDHPDHRHRCFAEGRPEPRALAHQEAFCLSPSFPGCPVFQDWARREAARPAGLGSSARPDQAPTARETPPLPGATAGAAAGIAGAEAAASATAGAGAAATSGPVPLPGADDVPAGPWDGWTSDPEDEARNAGAIPPRREQRRDWAAPPPWGGPSARPESRPAGDEPDEADAEAPRFLADRDAGQSTGRPAPDEARFDDDERRRRSAATGAAGLAAGAGLAGAAAASRGERSPAPEPPYEDLEDADYEPVAGPPSRRRSIAAGRLRDAERGESPPWERPRRSEAYPALKEPMSLPHLGPLAAAAAVLVIAALALFFVVPNLLIGSPTTGGGGSSANPSSAASKAASAPPATPAAPTPQVYVIKTGDTLSKIAKKFGITVDELLAANTTTIKDPNKIGLGQQIIIPVPGASVQPSAAASPSA
jgi:LysM repeat protein